MDISVVLATYNRAASLRTALASFSTLAIPPDLKWELLVVDNNSTDDTGAVVEEFVKTAKFRVRYLFEGTQGRSAALNAGIEQADGEIIAFTDDDITLDPDWLVSVKRTFSDATCMAVAGRVVPTWNEPKPDWLEMADQQAVVNFDFGDHLHEIEVPPLGANSAFRKQVFEKHGLFRLDLGVSGSKHTITCDDTEFGGRLIRASDKILYCPDAIVFHPVDPKRATKAYFVSWFYYNGRSLTRTMGLPNEGVFYFGIPRWLFRGFLTNLWKWLSTFDQTRRFHYKLTTYRSVGTMVESYRLSRLKTNSEVRAKVCRSGG